MTCIIADTGPLIGLAEISLLELSKRVFGSAALLQPAKFDY